MLFVINAQAQGGWNVIHVMVLVLEREERIKDEEYDEWYGRFQDTHGDAAVGPHKPGRQIECRRTSATNGN